MYPFVDDNLSLCHARARLRVCFLVSIIDTLSVLLKDYPQDLQMPVHDVESFTCCSLRRPISSNFKIAQSHSGWSETSPRCIRMENFPDT